VDPEFNRSFAPRGRRAPPGSGHFLYLRLGNREHFVNHLAQDRPEEYERHQTLDAKRAYLRGPESNELGERIGELKHLHGIADSHKVRLEPPP